MEMNNTNQPTKAPGVINAIEVGLNLTATHIYLFLIPALYDLILWLGPRFSVYNLLVDSITRLASEIVRAVPSTLLEQINSAVSYMENSLTDFNLLFLFHTIPIGIPSLLSFSVSGTTPMGKASVYQIDSAFTMVSTGMILIGLGILCGCIYCILTATISMKGKYHFSFKSHCFQILNLVLFIILFYIAAAVILMPFSCLLSSFSTASTGLINFFSILIFLVLAWLIVPLFFVIHGILIQNLNVFQSIQQSYQMSHWCTGSTSIFIITAIILIQGLNMVWTIPGSSSWMMLIGIFGHSFISASLLMASFVLFQNNLQWINQNKSILEKMPQFVNINNMTIYTQKNDSKDNKNDRK